MSLTPWPRPGSALPIFAQTKLEWRPGVLGSRILPSALARCPSQGWRLDTAVRTGGNGLWGMAGSPGPTVLQVPGRVGLAPGRGTTDGTLSGKGTLRAALMPLASISASLTSKGPRGLFPEEGKGGQQACVAEPCPVPCGLALALLTVH